MKYIFTVVSGAPRDPSSDCLVKTQDADGSVYWYRNGGDGRSWDEVLVATGNNVVFTAVAGADFEGDGYERSTPFLFEQGVCFTHRLSLSNSPYLIVRCFVYLNSLVSFQLVCAITVRFGQLFARGILSCFTATIARRAD
jgi:hypothetical protein